MIDYPAEWAKLPGEVILETSNIPYELWTQDLVAICATHTVPPDIYQPRVYKIAAYIPVSADFLRDVEDARQFANERLDRLIRPWAYVDRRVLPIFELFPKLTRWQCAIRHIRQYLTGRP